VIQWMKIDRDNLHIKCVALNVYFSRQSLALLRSRKPVHAGVKEGYSFHFIVVIFTAIGSSSVKTVAYSHRHDAYHNKHW